MFVYLCVLCLFISSSLSLRLSRSSVYVFPCLCVKRNARGLFVILPFPAAVVIPAELLLVLLVGRFRAMLRPGRGRLGEASVERRLGWHLPRSLRLGNLTATPQKKRSRPTGVLSGFCFSSMHVRSSYCVPPVFLRS